MQTGHLRHALNFDRPVRISRFSSTALAQSENIPLGSDSSTAGAEWFRSTNQEPEIGESQGKPNDSSTVIKGLQDSAPKMTIADLTRALGVTGVHKSGRLRARTARIMMHEIRRRFNEQLFEYRAITSGRHRQTSSRANFQSTRIKPERGNTNQGESVTRHIPLKDKGDSRKKKTHTKGSSDNAKKKLIASRKGKTAESKEASNPKTKKTQVPPIRRLSIESKPIPEALSKSLRMLSFKVSRLADEAGALIVAIRSRQPRTAQKPQARSSTRSPRFLHRQHTARPRLLTERPRVRRVQAQSRPRVNIKSHPSFSLGTIRFPDGSRAKLKRRTSPQYPLSSLSSRSMGRGSVLRRVPVDATVAVQRKREARRLRGKREREARKLAETVESWLGGGGAGGMGGIM